MNNLKENLLCLLMGTAIAIMFLALLLGQGSKGLIDMF
jgi:hypothetical protein